MFAKRALKAFYCTVTLGTILISNSIFTPLRRVNTCMELKRHSVTSLVLSILENWIIGL